MVAYGNKILYSNDKPPAHFNYVLDIYGPNQLTGVYHTPTVDTLYSVLGKFPSRIQARLDIAKYIFGFDPKQDSVRALEVMKKYSPYTLVNKLAPPTLIIHGDKDRIVPLDQSIRLHRKLDSLHVENEFHIVKGADHAFVNATPEEKNELQKWIVDFIRQHYSNKDIKQNQ